MNKTQKIYLRAGVAIFLYMMSLVALFVAAQAAFIDEWARGSFNLLAAYGFAIAADSVLEKKP